MADHWQDHGISSAQVKGDVEDAPDDWENELEEKLKSTDVEEKSNVLVKAPTTTKNKANKKKFDDDQEIVKQPDGDYTPAELDEIKMKQDIEKEQVKLDMVSELVDKNNQCQSLDNINLVTKDEFLNYSLHLSNQLEILSKSEFYPEFLDHFLTGITKPMTIDGVKRLLVTSEAIHIRKQSDERERKAKLKTKKKAKPQLRTGRQAEYKAFGADDDHDFDVDDEDDI